MGALEMEAKKWHLFGTTGIIWRAYLRPLLLWFPRTQGESMCVVTAFAPLILCGIMVSPCQVFPVLLSRCRLARYSSKVAGRSH